MFWFAESLLLGWLPVVLLLFFWMPPRRAVVVSLITSWLFLPQLGYTLRFVPDYTKMSATCYAIIIGALLLDPKSRVLNFKPLWIDLPMLVYCAVPFFTSLQNELGAYDGLTSCLARIVQHGLPYLIGRLYIRTPEDAKEFAFGVVAGALIYVPLCLYEARMSPQLHNIVYGITPYTDWAMAWRWGGWRPTVFLSHGLAVGVWMAAGATMAVWLWTCGSVKRIYGIPMWLVAPLLVLTSVLTRSTGAIMLFVAVSGLLLSVRYLQTRLFLMGALVSIPLYLLARTTQLFEGVFVAEWISGLGSTLEHRGNSLRFRMVHENFIVNHVYDRPFLGWGGWGRAFDVYIEEYDSLAVPDSLWALTFGQNGIVGLAALYSIYIIPPVLLLKKLRAREVGSKAIAPVTGLAAVCLLYAMDCLVNAMINPVFIVAIGGVAGMAATLTRGVADAAPADAGPAGARSDGDAPADDLLIDVPAPSAPPMVMLDPPSAEGPMGSAP